MIIGKLLGWTTRILCAALILPVLMASPGQLLYTEDKLIPVLVFLALAIFTPTERR